jgi:hypothetical protein
MTGRRSRSTMRGKNQARARFSVAKFQFSNLSITALT